MLMFVNLVLGVISRVAPQIGVFSVGFPLTVSIGGTKCPAAANVSELMRAADKRLYEAKNRGRNLAIFDSGMSAAA